VRFWQTHQKNVEADLGTEYDQTPMNHQTGNTNADDNQHTNKDDTQTEDARLGSMTEPSSWTGTHTLDQDDIRVDWDDRTDTHLFAAETSDADGEGWTETVHQQRAYEAIRIRNLYCDGIEKMEFELELIDEHLTLSNSAAPAFDGAIRNHGDRVASNDNEVMLSKFKCMSGEDQTDSGIDTSTSECGLDYRKFTADDAYGDGGRVFNGINGMVSLDPYKCKVDDNRNLFDSDLSDSTVTVQIEFRVVSTQDNQIEFHKYLVEASCEFNKIYNTKTEFQARQKTSAIDTEIFQLLDSDFDIHMSGDSMDNGGDDSNGPVFRANENIEAIIFTKYEAQSRRKWEKLNINLGYAPVQCKVEQLRTGTADLNDDGTNMSTDATDDKDLITIFDINRVDLGGDTGNRGGHPALEFEMSSSTRLRVWYFKYIAFVMADDDNQGNYELQCALQPCYYEITGDTNRGSFAGTDYSNVCNKAMQLQDVTHEGAPLNAAGDDNQTNFQKIKGQDRDGLADFNDFSVLFDSTHQD